MAAAAKLPIELTTSSRRERVKPRAKMCSEGRYSEGDILYYKLNAYTVHCQVLIMINKREAIMARTRSGNLRAAKASARMEIVMSRVFCHLQNQATKESEGV